MRCFKLLLIGAAVLALAVPAMATGIPFTTAYNGPTYWQATDLTMGSIYNPAGQPTDSWLDATTVPLLQPPPGGAAGEDGWTIFRVNAMYKGSWAGPNTIDAVDTGNPLYSDGYAGREVVGFIHGRQDLFVKFNSDGSQDFLFAGDDSDLYVQPHGTFASETRTLLGLPADGSGDPSRGIWGAAGSSGRLDPTNNPQAYVGIGHDSTGTAIPNTLSLTMNSEAGYYPPEFDGFGNQLPTWGAQYDPVEGRAHFLFDAATGSGSGDSDIYYSVVGGDPNYWPNWDTNAFYPNRTGAAAGTAFNNADLRIHVTTSPVTQTSTYDWLAQSSDPVTGTFVPEPLTMAGLMLGIGALGGYIRRRR